MKTPTLPLRQQFVFSQKAKHQSNPFLPPYHLKEFLVPAFERIAVYGNARLVLVLKNPGDTIYAEGEGASIAALNVYVQEGTLTITNLFGDHTHSPLEVTIPVWNRDQVQVQYHAIAKDSIY